MTALPALHPELCARRCGRKTTWFYHDEWVCDPCYRAEEFRPGHVLTGDAAHFRGICNDCDARRAAGMTLGQVENLYRQGVFGQDLFEAYCHVWATGAFRYGAVSPSWLESPVIPEVVRLVAVMRGGLALRVNADKAMKAAR
jgi:hypothetical protein